MIYSLVMVLRIYLSVSIDIGGDIAQVTSISTNSFISPITVNILLLKPIAVRPGDVDENQYFHCHDEDVPLHDEDVHLHEAEVHLS